LLELILSHLPTRDLLVTTPLVSKTWLALTLTPALQRALFFQPDTLSTPLQNPLLAEIFPPFFTPGPPDENTWKWPGTARAIRAIPWSKAPDAFKQEDASWRRMLVEQPPAQTLILEETCFGRSGNAHRQAVVNGLSLRMGDLYDLAVPYSDCAMGCIFCVHWPGDEVEHEGESGLTLAVTYTEGCDPKRSGGLGDFYSDGFRENAGHQIVFGDWVLSDFD
ncbi:hypothetical protein B0H14DRAFT_2395695, partial [Mycena olivaceomarginata]